MTTTSFWVSEQLLHEVLSFCGNSAPSNSQLTLVQSLLGLLTENSQCEPVNTLSERERTFLFWVACGKTFEETLVLMNITEACGRRYRQRILAKLKCQNMSQALFIAMRFQTIHCRQ